MVSSGSGSGFGLDWRCWRRVRKSGRAKGKAWAVKCCIAVARVDDGRSGAEGVAATGVVATGVVSDRCCGVTGVVSFCSIDGLGLMGVVSVGVLGGDATGRDVEDARGNEPGSWGDRMCVLEEDADSGGSVGSLRCCRCSCGAAAGAAAAAAAVGVSQAK